MNRAPQVSVADNDLPRDVAKLLFAQWMGYLTSERLGFNQTGASGNESGSQWFSFAAADGRKIVLSAVGDSEWAISECDGLPIEDAFALVVEAAEQVAARNTGDDVVYEVRMRAAPATIDSNMMLNFMRALGDQIRMLDWRRLGGAVLLHFSEEGPDDPSPLLFAPSAEIRILMFIPGPSAGPLASRLAGAIAETVQAICTLALGRVVTLDFGGVMFPASSEVSTEARAMRGDLRIGNLARDSVSLDIFDDLVNRAGGDGFQRARGALLSYHSALTQVNADVATMLFVTAMEALVAPRHEWGKDKVTTRFINFFEELCPDAVDALLDHDNVKAAFGANGKVTGRAVQVANGRTCWIESMSCDQSPIIRELAWREIAVFSQSPISKVLRAWHSSRN